MKHSRLFGTSVWLLLAGLGACVKLPAADQQSGDVAAVSCPRHPQQGCPCTEGTVASCFLTDTPLPDDQVMCTEGTRVCRGGHWSSCENTHEYVVAKRTDQQAIIEPTGGDPTCSQCDILCFRAVDSLSFEDGLADGSVAFGSGGGLTLPQTSGLAADAGLPSSCVALDECCYGLTDPLLSTCRATAKAGVQTACDSELAAYCAARTIDGPIKGCTKGAGIDTDCDGIPNPVDSADGGPFADTTTQAIFHELGPGKSATDALSIEYKIKSADIYILFDTTGTMADARDNLLSLLTTGNVVHCAQLAQCCGTNSTCLSVANAGDAANCYAKQVTYCPRQVPCADNNRDGLPDDDLATKGVLGGISCLIADARFGLGGFREIPLYKDSVSSFSLLEGGRYGDRDEQLFRHMVDITSSQAAIGKALTGISMNYNWDAPEGANLALYSLATGKGHYFGIHRPAVPDRSDGAGCPANTFGYPCFRNNAVPVVVLFTDAPQHNGPGSTAWSGYAQDCAGRGLGCPYSDLTTPNTYTSGSTKDSATDRIAHYVPASAENGSTAYPLGDVRGKYLSMVGDTTHMMGDYTGSKITCGSVNAANTAPDAVIQFDVSSGPDVDINFHFTKDDAYADQYYGAWASFTDNDPTPATDFGSLLAVFKTTPEAATSAVGCHSDVKSTAPNNSWHKSAADLTIKLGAGTYYAVIKGITATDAGHFQLQIGEAATAGKAQYTAPLWADTSAALKAAKIRVIPVVANGSYSSFESTAQKQAEALALATAATRSNGSALWYSLANNASSKTGQAVVNAIADLSKNLAMNITLSAIDGPDSSTAFQMNVTPQNTVGCLPHPLVDPVGVCNKTIPGKECNTQYDCRPGAVPKFLVTFTNPSASPVPPNTRAGSYGGYLFKLQLKQDKQFLLAEIPVFLIPNQVASAPLPFKEKGEYEQYVTAKSCLSAPDDEIAGTTVQLPNNLPSWRDLYFDANVPDGTSIDFQFCTSDNEKLLSMCNWTTRPRITVTGQGMCNLDSDCVQPSGLGYGTCASNHICRYITPAKIWPDVSCTADTNCPNGPLGAGEYLIKSRCDTMTGSPTLGRCITVSEPADIGATLAATEDGLLYSKVHVTLHSSPSLKLAPELFQWYVTYSCHAAL